MEVKSAATKTARSTSGSAEIDSKTMLRVLEAVQHGDFSARMPSASPRGSANRVAAALNASRCIYLEDGERADGVTNSA